MLKTIASQESNIGEVSKSGQLVEIENKVVIWTPGDGWVRFKNQNEDIIELKIKTVESWERTKSESLRSRKKN